MQANVEMNEGRAALARIIDSFPPESEHWNEAQNRFQFIDRLLTECLGWQQPWIEVERFDDTGGRADYLLGKPVRAALEAKKEAKKFNFLPTVKPHLARKLRPLIEACPNLKAACSQVVGYCAINGARLAIACNGPQMVIFQNAGDGNSPLDGDCFVFNGFNSYILHFDTLWRFLSPEGVFENIAFRALAELQNPRVPVKASTALGEPKAYRYRTPFQDNLRTLASVLLDDIESSPAVKSDFYKECYVPLDANNRHLLLSKNIISARYKRVSDNGITPARLATKVEKGGIKINDDIAAVTNGRPLVVVGDVGVGKTSFFENLFEQLDDLEKSRTCYIHINLGEEAALSSSVNSYIIQKIPSLFREKYGINISTNSFAQKLYEQELLDFDDSVDGQLRDIDPSDYAKAKISFLSSLVNDKSSHLMNSLSYIVKTLNRQIMIVLDNADQRTFETQQEAFLVAQELASSRTMMVFVALRPATFYASKLGGALSGYKNEVLTISPPPADEVIRKRITFALRVAEGRIAPAALEGVNLNLTNIVLFLKAMLRSIRSSSEIKTFLSNITGGNTRLVIELVTSFCGSPNVESERIVRIESETGDYKVPLHEFTKHALLGEYAHYNRTSSLVACNVFDISKADKREHFLALLLIGFLTSPTGIRDNDGFVPGSSVMTEMIRLGFDESQVRASLKRLAEHRLIETPHAQYREIAVEDNILPESFYFRATSVGIYHARYWVGTFAFLDATCIDTPIFDDDRRKIVFDHSNSFDISDRYQKSAAFAEYLETVWHNSNFDVNYYDFQAAVDGQQGTFASVERHLRSNPRTRYLIE